MNRVCAVVVTYNRKDLLERCINAVRSQTASVGGILVVNNGSTDGTGDWLDSQKDIRTIHQGNVGGSGGFNRGAIEAVKLGYDAVWMMDDDGYPDSSALEELLKFSNLGSCVLNSVVVDKESMKLSFPLWNLGERLNHYEDVSVLHQDCILGVINPFNGTLIPSKIIELIGPPYGDMFIWGDEVEYFFRMRKFSVPVVTVTKSLLFHPLAKEVEGEDWTDGISWRKYYSTRNRYRVFKAMNLGLPGIRFTKFVALLMLEILSIQKSKRFSKLVMIFGAYVHAIMGNYGLLPAEVWCLKPFLGKKN